MSTKYVGLIVSPWTPRSLATPVGFSPKWSTTFCEMTLLVAPVSQIACTTIFAVVAQIGLMAQSETKDGARPGRMNV